MTMKMASGQTRASNGTFGFKESGAPNVKLTAHYLAESAKIPSDIPHSASGEEASRWRTDCADSRARAAFRRSIAEEGDQVLSQHFDSHQGYIDLVSQRDSEFVFSRVAVLETETDFHPLDDISPERMVKWGLAIDEWFVAAEIEPSQYTVEAGSVIDPFSETPLVLHRSVFCNH